MEACSRQQARRLLSAPCWLLRSALEHTRVASRCAAWRRGRGGRRGGWLDLFEEALACVLGDLRRLFELVLDPDLSDRLLQDLLELPLVHGLVAGGHVLRHGQGLATAVGEPCAATQVFDAEAVLRLLSQQPSQQLEQLGRGLVGLGVELQLAVADRLHEHEDRGCLERKPVEHPHIHAHAEGPDVRSSARVDPRAGLVVAAHLGRVEGGRARGGPDVILVLASLGDRRHAEVRQLGPFVHGVPEDILRLDVGLGLGLGLGLGSP